MPDVTENTKLENVTCQCGEDYFQADGSWVSSVDVRSGKAPPKVPANGQAPLEASTKGQEQFRILSSSSSES